MILKLAAKLLASSFQYFASLYVNTPFLSNPMSYLVEKRALKSLLGQGIAFLSSSAYLI